MKILYYDCFAGISGDMNLGAMIDLGIEAEYLKNELAKAASKRVYPANYKGYQERDIGYQGKRTD